MKHPEFDALCNELIRRLPTFGKNVSVKDYNLHCTDECSTQTMQQPRGVHND